MIIKKATKNLKNESIVFVHGAWHGAWCWEKYFMNIFSENGYDCYAFNLRNHSTAGPISNINKTTLKNYAEDLHAVIKKIPQNPILIGHSMGGAIIQRYLKKYNKGKKIVLMASCPPRGTFLSNIKNKTIVRNSFVALKNSCNTYEIIKNEEDIKTLFFSNQIHDDVIKEAKNKLCSESLSAVIGFMAPLIKKPKISVPVLVLAAEQDNVISMKDNHNTEKKYNATLIKISNCAHDMMLDVKHKEAALEIINWIEKN